MQVALTEQVLFDACFDAVAGQGAVGEDDGAFAALFSRCGHQDEKEVGASPWSGNSDGKSVSTPRSPSAAKGRIGEDHVDAVRLR